MKMKRSILDMMQDVPRLQDTDQTPESYLVQIVMDSSATRMCMKYKLNPKAFLVKCLEDELHRLAIEEEIWLKKCPHCGKALR